MKRFLTRVFAYCLIIITAGNIIIYLALKIFPGQMLDDPFQYYMWNYVKSEAGLKTSKHKNIILGDSKSLAAIAPQIIRHNFVNFSIGGGSPFEGYFILKRYLKINKIDTLIVSFSANKLAGHVHVLPGQTIAWNFTSAEDIKGLEMLEKKYHRCIDNKPPGTFLNIYRTLYQLQFPFFYRTTFVNSIKNICSGDSDAIKLKVVKNQLVETGHCFFGNRDSSNDLGWELATNGDLEHFDVNPVCLSYIDSIYQLSIKNNIKVIYVTTPCNYSTYKDLHNTKFYIGYSHFIDSLKFRYPQISVFNKYPFLADSFFGDANHLNQKGCDFFSKYLFEELNSSGK